MNHALLIRPFLTLAAVAALAACSSGSTDGTVPTGTAGTTVIPTVGGNNGTAGTTPVGTGGSSAGTSPISTGGTVVGTGGSVVGTGGTVVGTSGSTSTAGMGGMSGGSGGTGGSVAGTGGSDNAGGHASGSSPGCTKVPADAFGKAVLKMIDINGMAAQYTAGYTHRKYCTTLPAGYDPAKPYPAVFYGPGCGATACEGNSFSGRTDIIIVQAIAGADAKGANLVPPNGAPGCFQAGKESTEDSPEGPYFDQVMAQVENDFCIDKGKVYAAGTSSGAWLSNYLACARGNAIRGTASDSGGIQFNRPMCTGGAAVMEMPGDSTNTKDSKGNEIGSGLARDMFIKLNGCSMTPTAMTFGGAGCQVYGGCASPVAWCDVGGGHQSGNGKLSAATQAFWATLQ